MSLLAEDILDVLATVIDPDLGMNIVDLGLVYDVQVHGDTVSISMTMTTPACPIASHLVEQAKAMVRSQFPTLQNADIELVWEPASLRWDYGCCAMILPAGRSNKRV